MLFLDLETTGLSPIKDRIHGVGLLWEGGHSPQYLYPHAGLRIAAQCVVGHNAMFDLRFLLRKGHLAALPNVIHDTAMMARLVDENASAALDELTQRHLPAGNRLAAYGDVQSLCHQHKVAHVGQLAKLDLAYPAMKLRPAIASYCIEDLENTRALFYHLRDKIAALSSGPRFGGNRTIRDYYYDEALPFYSALLRIEEGGLLLDLGRLENARIQAGAALTHATNNIAQILQCGSARYTELRQEREREERIAKFKTEKRREEYRANPTFKFRINLGSYEQLGEVLRLQGLDLSSLPLTKKGTPKLGDVERGILRRENPKQELLWDALDQEAALSKYLDAFILATDKLREGDRVYPEYSTAPVTGRLACASPNIQQLPHTSKEGPTAGISIRGLYVAPPGKVFAHFDASQVELRIAAHLSQEPSMLAAYREGTDLHKATAGAIYGIPSAEVTDAQRQAGKSCNFLMIFRGGPGRLQQQLAGVGAVFTIEECKGIIDRFFALYPKYKAYLDGVKAHAFARLEIQAANGRVRRLPELAYARHFDYKRKRLTEDTPKWLIALLQEALPKYYEEGRCETIYEVARRIVNHAEKQAYNFPIQSVGASIVKAGIIALQAAGYTVVCTVHDAIDVALPSGAATTGAFEHIERILNDCYPLTVPLKWEGKLLKSFDDAEKA